MKSNKALAVLCCLMAVMILTFTGMLFMKLKVDRQTEVPVSYNYDIADAVETDKPAKEVAAVEPNCMKGVKFPEGILDSMKTAYAVNKNCVGRISIPGTEIDTVIIQGKDNSRYLTYNFYEIWTSEVSGTLYGNVFLDYQCRNDEYLSKNTILHGHTTGKSDNIPKQSFRSLYDYRSKEHFIECPIIKYTTLYNEYTFKICDVFYSTTQPGYDNGYFFNYIYPDMSDSNMVGYIDQVNQRRLYDTGVSLEPTDNIITLSTCIYDFGKSIDTRLVVVGRLLHEGEDESIDASLVKDNPDYRRPQKWYDNHGKKNPYKNAEKWKPSAE
ncbi:MAG: class B sortase [Clostridia bacterium]|nr:class B sortase [Clostridia bacterium]